jgi:hypothetical protein
MNGREKSHSAIVAVKPTNKAGRLVAEPAEPRAGTEGNAKPGRHALDSEPGKRVTRPGWRTGRQQGALLEVGLAVTYPISMSPTCNPG